MERLRYKLGFDLSLLHTHFRRTVEQVSYIHVFLIVVLLYMSYYMYSTRSILPNFHRLKA